MSHVSATYSDVVSVSIQHVAVNRSGGNWYKLIIACKDGNHEVNLFGVWPGKAYEPYDDIIWNTDKAAWGTLVSQDEGSVSYANWSPARPGFED